MGPAIVRFATLLLFAMSLVMSSAPQVGAAPQIGPAEDGARKVNLSGRQRMLTQRMAKAVCFKAIGIDAGMHDGMAREAHALFASTLAGLRNGDADLGVLPTTDPATLEALSKVDVAWADFGPAVIAALDGDAAAQERVFATNADILGLSDAAVGEYVRTVDGSRIEPSLAKAIDVAGRQRMLSQKMAKEFCQIVRGAPGDMRATMADTADLFESSHFALLSGDGLEGIAPPPSPDVEYLLLSVAETVSAFLKPIRAVAGGAAPTDEDIQMVATLNNRILVDMNEAVWLYENF